jgi:hypothetical protein
MELEPVFMFAVCLKLRGELWSFPLVITVVISEACACVGVANKFGTLKFVLKAMESLSF